MKDKLQALKDHLCDLGYEDAIVFDDKAYVDAYIGMSSDGRPVYSYDKMVECLMVDDDMTYEDAVEWIEYNTIRALPYYPNGPIVLYDDPEYMWKDDEPEAEIKEEKPTCPRYSEGYGCEISPEKHCESCENNPNKNY